MPLALEGPLAVGTPAKQGSIRCSVEAYEPAGWCFRFASGLGLIPVIGDW